jgi:putative redox protein
VSEANTPEALQASAGGPINDGQISGRAYVAEFPIGHGENPGDIPGAAPYDLLSASLAACTALTLRYFARTKNFALSHVDVAVSYTHGKDGVRDKFERVVSLKGDLSDDDKAQLLRLSEYCPVSKAFRASADIVTCEAPDLNQSAIKSYTSYEEYLAQLPVINVDPD